MSDKYPGGFVTANAPAGFSVAFDGTGDYLSVNNAAFNFSGTDFTIEFWLYNTGTTSDTMLLQWGSGASGDIQFVVNQGGTSGAIALGTSGVAKTAASVSANNRWVYVAGVRSGTTYYTYVDGTRYTTQSSGTPSSSTSFNIASGMTGYISNLRISNTARYTSTTMVVPNILQTDANTKLWTCLGYPIVDQSGNSYTITINGDTKVSNFTPLQGYTGFNPALGAAAGGVWTLDEAAYYQNNRQWPIYDPYFNQTTLMLHGNGTNGAQNNTFLDSSTNNFTITRNGNTTQGTFSPFSQTGWSNYFTTSDGLSIGTAVTVGNTWTLECWFTVQQTGQTILVNGNGATGDPWIGLNGGYVYFSFGGTTRTFLAPYSLYTWYHLALTCNAGTVTVYLNGVQQGATQASPTSNFTVNRIGGYNGGGANAWFGYISNLRITNTVVYSSNFTPSTQPLTAITGTALLTCQSNRFVDNSATAAAITVFAGSPSVQAFSPFVPAYITPTTYSNWFDGTGDYLSSSSANYVCAGDFTVEAWFYATSNPSFGGIISTRNSTAPDGFNINLDSAQKIRFFINNNDFPAGYVSYNLNQWYHVAMVRSGSGSNNVTAYVNGISVGSVTNTSTTTTSSLVIGRFYTDLDNYYLNGVVSNVRLVNGTALYTANFTPPNAPFPTGTTNQQLLTCQASTLIDSNTYTTAKTITANGNVQPVTSPTPFPAKVDTTTLNSAYSTSLIGGSGYFDGSGDYLTSPSNAAYQFDSGNFTVELWVNFSVVANAQLLSVPVSGGLYFQYYSSALDFGCNGVGNTSTAWSPKANTWYHLAAVRNGSNITVYVNGAVLVSTTAFNITATGTLQIGYGGAGTFNGYMSGLRFVKGTAVYTSAFAPPLTPPTAITNTSLLLNYTNGAIFDNTAKNVLETVGNAQISTTQSKWGGSSMYFDGTGDWLNAGKNEMFSIGSAEDFTFEAWIYAASVSDVSVFGIGSSTFFAYRILSGSPYIYVQTTGGLLNAGTITANTWTHIAISRSSGTMRSFLNGIQAASVANTGSFSASAGTGAGVYVGAANLAGASTPGYVFNGYIDDLRFTKGVARYVTNFTPPTSQLQDQ